MIAVWTKHHEPTRAAGDPQAGGLSGLFSEADTATSTVPIPNVT
jgi:hypothetical protein